MKVIIAAAGTGGHINPAIAIANKIKQEDNKSEILFIGTSRGLENDLVPRAGYQLEQIEAYGLSKEISLSNFKKMYATFKSISKVKKIIKEFKPDIMIGTGGYICGPVATAAKSLNVPILLHESNAFPGKAVKMLSKKADTILVSFEEAKEKLMYSKNVIYTGTPVKIVKNNYKMIEKNNIIKNSGLIIDKPIILVFGGSQGSQKINDSVVQILINKKNLNYQIYWATGLKQYNSIKEELNKNNIDIEKVKNAKIVPYIYNMEEIMNVSDVIVARSGAMTITEISNLGKPSILIPLPNVSGDHQLHNAKVLENIGASKIILNNELNENILDDTINKIVLDKEKMENMGKLALSKATCNVEDKIYKEIQKLIKN